MKLSDLIQAPRPQRLVRLAQLAPHVAEMH